MDAGSILYHDFPSVVVGVGVGVSTPKKNQRLSEWKHDFNELGVFESQLGVSNF